MYTLEEICKNMFYLYLLGSTIVFIIMYKWAIGTSKNLSSHVFLNSIRFYLGYFYRTGNLQL